MSQLILVFLVICLSIVAILFLIAIFFIFQWIKEWYFENREKAFLTPRPNKRYYFYRWTRDIFWKGVFPFLLLVLSGIIVWGSIQNPLHIDLLFFKQNIYLLEIIQITSGIAASVGVLIALFDVKSTQFLNKIKARSVVVPFPMQNSKEDFGIKLCKHFNNGFWSFPVFDISHANTKLRFPIFYIKNISKEGFATNVVIKLCEGTRGNKKEKIYDFVGKTVVEDTQYDIAPGNGIVIYKDEGYANTIDFTSNFAIKINYLSEYTKEEITEIYEAVVEIKDLYFVVQKWTLCPNKSSKADGSCNFQTEKELDDNLEKDFGGKAQHKIQKDILDKYATYEYKFIYNKLIRLEEDKQERQRKIKEFEKHNKTHLDFTKGKWRYIEIEKNLVNFLTPGELSSHNTIVLKTKGGYISHFRKKFT